MLGSAATGERARGEERAYGQDYRFGRGRVRVVGWNAPDARRARGHGFRARPGTRARVLEEAWETWARDGVGQFRLAHFLAPAGRVVLEERLPDVLEAILAAGALRMDLLGTDAPQPGRGRSAGR